MRLDGLIRDREALDLQREVVGLLLSSSLSYQPHDASTEAEKQSQESGRPSVLAKVGSLLADGLAALKVAHEEGAPAVATHAGHMPAGGRPGNRLAHAFKWSLMVARCT